jgi:diaminohydroxyphosphoribosylaminopyrimidine deaminase/5-amino-6-(5-phosphoribosylamino)uracil reductase
MIDEVHVFIAAKLSGGQAAPSPIGGEGIDRMAEALPLNDVQVQHVGADLYLTGRIEGRASSSP